MKEGFSGGASVCEGFHQGDFEGGFIYWGTLLLLLLLLLIFFLLLLLLLLRARGRQGY
jgi:hypothetical protein